MLFSIDPSDDGIKKCVHHLSSLLDIKTDSEYGSRFSTRVDAENSKKHAERIFDFVKAQISKILR